MIPEAIVLAGGLGTRLQSVVPDLPKCLAPVAGRSFLEYLLDCYGNRVLNVSFLPWVIKQK